MSFLVAIVRLSSVAEDRGKPAVSGSVVNFSAADDERTILNKIQRKAPRPSQIEIRSMINSKRVTPVIVMPILATILVTLSIKKDP